VTVAGVDEPKRAVVPRLSKNDLISIASEPVVVVVLVVGATYLKIERRRHFKSDRDEILHDWSSSKYRHPLTESDF